MASKWVPDEEVQVGKNGKFAVFTLGHSWATGSGSTPARSEHAWHYGYRDHVDPEKLALYANKGVSLDCFMTVEDVTAKACDNLLFSLKADLFFKADYVRETISLLAENPFDLNPIGRSVVRDNIQAVTGSSLMEDPALEDEAFRAKWAETVATLPALLVEWEKDVAIAQRVKNAKKVRFVASCEGVPMVRSGLGKIAFLDRGSEGKPEIGETWYVEIVGQNPKGTVYFVNAIRRFNND